MDQIEQSPEIVALADTVPPEEQEAIARFAGVTVEHPSFRPYLGIARHLGLSPLLSEIWLIETDVFDRDSGNWRTDLRPAVGRDGFLKVARRDENVIVPPRSNVVCANDHFTFTDKGDDVEIEHSATLTPSEGEAPPEAVERAKAGEAAGIEAEVRGPVLGAWAKLRFRDGSPPFFYYAPISEHGKRGAVAQDGDDPTDGWLGAWSYTHAMIAKCAQSYVLRIGARITGVVPADEIRGGTESLVVAGSGGRSGPAKAAPVDNASIVMALPVPDELRSELIASLAEVNRLSPFSWATAKVAIVLADADEDQARKVRDQIDGEIAKLKGQA